MARALEIRNLSKSFGGLVALDSVCLNVESGEVHGLVGQNGSGKSTIVKILAGYHKPEPGAEILIGGEPIPIPVVGREARRLGLAFVHQDLGLIPTLSVLENFLLDRLSTEGEKWISWKRERCQALETFELFGVELDPAALVGSLAVSDRALLAIIRAVGELRRGRADRQSGAGVLVLDEATASLPEGSRDRLFSLVREVVSQGEGVLFVSHYLNEIREITDRVTVLRDGRVVDTTETGKVSTDELVRLILGRDLAPAARYHAETRGPAETLAKIVGLKGGLVDDVSFVVEKGEVLGLTGLLGSGFEEVPALLFGAKAAERGKVELKGKVIDLAGITPYTAIQAGLAYVPADRLGEGLMPQLSVQENILSQVLGQHASRGALKRWEMARHARDLVEEFGVTPPEPTAQLADLSGGNQQKVLIAKWLATGPTLLVLYEPTHGVDVGSRRDIVEKLRAITHDGVGVLCASGDPELLEELCDRVLILGNGRVADELSGDGVMKDVIVERSYHAESVIFTFADSLTMANIGKGAVPLRCLQRNVGVRLGQRLRRDTTSRTPAALPLTAKARAELELI
jgi:ribose transport system ATP-binding protein